MLKSISEGVIATDLTGQIRFMNPMAEDLTGCLEEKVLGRDVRVIFSPFGYNLPLKEDLACDESYFKNTVLRLEGEKLTIEGSVTVIKDIKDSVDGFVIIFHPVKT